MIKEILLFINAHRDGCTVDMIVENIDAEVNEIESTLTTMESENLIEMHDSLVLITGGYTDERYSDIY